MRIEMKRGLVALVSAPILGLMAASAAMAEPEICNRNTGANCRQRRGHGHPVRMQPCDAGVPDTVAAARGFRKCPAGDLGAMSGFGGASD